MRYGMIAAVRRSILLLSVLYCAELFSGPLSAVDSLKIRLERLETATAAVERRQAFRSARRVSRGRMVYSRELGSVYIYRSPGRFRFFSGDSLASGADLNENEGWKLTDKRRLTAARTRIDPLFRLYQLRSVPSNKVAYTGTAESMMFFSWSDEAGGKYVAGIAVGTYRCGMIERFGENGRLTEKTAFIYGKGGKNTAVPSMIVISERIGSAVAIDTVILKHVRINRAFKKNLFAEPGTIVWKEWREPLLHGDKINAVPGR